jgi:hypothetical protein
VIVLPSGVQVQRGPVYSGDGLQPSLVPSV